MQFLLNGGIRLATLLSALPVALICRMPSACAVGQITCTSSPVPPRQEGRVANVTKREAGCGGRRHAD